MLGCRPSVLGQHNRELPKDVCVHSCNFHPLSLQNTVCMVIVEYSHNIHTAVLLPSQDNSFLPHVPWVKPLKAEDATEINTPVNIQAYSLSRAIIWLLAYSLSRAII